MSIEQIVNYRYDELDYRMLWNDLRGMLEETGLPFASKSHINFTWTFVVEDTVYRLVFYFKTSSISIEDDTGVRKILVNPRVDETVEAFREIVGADIPLSV